MSEFLDCLYCFEMLIWSFTSLVRGLALLRLFSSTFFGWSIFHNPFSYQLSRLQKVDFVSFYLSSHFYFLFDLFFIVSIFRTLGVGIEVISHISHIWWCGHNIDHGTWEKGVEDSGTKWYHTTWTPHVGLMLHTWSFRVGCTVASTDPL